MSNPASEDLRAKARDLVNNLPAETALGGTASGADQAAMPAGSEGEDLAGAEAGVIDLTDGLTDTGGAEVGGGTAGSSTEPVDIGGSNTPLGDESTGGQAAREALGVAPARTGSEIHDPTLS